MLLNLTEVDKIGVKVTTTPTKRRLLQLLRASDTVVRTLVLLTPSPSYSQSWWEGGRDSSSRQPTARQNFMTELSFLSKPSCLRPDWSWRGIYIVTPCMIHVPAVATRYHRWPEHPRPLEPNTKQFFFLFHVLSKSISLQNDVFANL